MKSFEFKGKVIAVTNLRSDNQYNSLPANTLTIAGGVYETKNGREEWTGESFRGEIPFLALLTWAYDKGYVSFEGKKMWR